MDNIFPDGGKGPRKRLLLVQAEMPVRAEMSGPSGRA